MFRRKYSSLKMLGIITTSVGVIMFLYIIPPQIWFFIVAIIFIIVGLFLCRSN